MSETHQPENPGHGADSAPTTETQYAPPPGTEVHVYDGIVEHDNFLPRWWLGIIYGTIAFSIGYYGYYELGGGPSLREEYAVAMKQLDAAKAAAGSGAADGSASGSGSGSASGLGGDEEAVLVAWASSTDHVNQGKVVYDAKCAVCHGKAGEGGIGPNLTDDFWLHGAKHAQIAATIRNGVNDKGMPPWGAVLSNDEFKSTVVFVRSLHGTNPPNAKGPQGEKAAF